MAWTAPTAVTVGQILTAAKWNTDVQNNLRYLKGVDGPVTIDDQITTSGAIVQSTGGGGYNAARPLILRRTDSSVNPTGRIEFQGSNGGSGNRWAILTDADAVNDFGVAYNGSKFVEVLTNGNVGLGTSSPQGRLDVRNAVGGCMVWSANNIDASAQVLPPGSVARAVTCVYCVTFVATTPVSQGTGVTGVTLGRGDYIFNSSPNLLSLSCGADGSVSVIRTGGTATYRASLWLVWC